MNRQIIFYALYTFIFVFSIPLILKKVKRNEFYGIRTSKALSDEESWYKYNRIGGWILAVGSFIALLFLLVGDLFPGIVPDSIKGDMRGFSVIPLVISVIITLIFTM